MLALKIRTFGFELLRILENRFIELDFDVFPTYGLPKLSFLVKKPAVNH